MGTIDPEDRRVREVRSLAIVRDNGEIVRCERIDTAVPLAPLIVGDSDLLALLDSSPDSVGIALRGPGLEARLAFLRRSDGLAGII